MEIIIAFNFSHAAILDFMMSLHCPIDSNKRTLAFQQPRESSDVMKSKMAARRKSKSQNLFPLLLLNVTFPLYSKICNLGIICAATAEVQFKHLVFVNHQLRPKTTSSLTGCSLKWPGQGCDSSSQLPPQAVCPVTIPSNFSAQFHSQSRIPPVGNKTMSVTKVLLLILIFSLLASCKIQ